MGVRGLRPDTIGGLFTALARRVDQLDRRLTAFIESFVGAGEHTHDFEISVEQEGVFVGQAGILNFIAGPGGNVGVTDQGDVANIVIGAEIQEVELETRPYIIIASDQTSDEMKEAADYVCDGEDDQVEVLLALQDRLDTHRPLYFTDGFFRLNLLERLDIFWGPHIGSTGSMETPGPLDLGKTTLLISVLEDFVPEVFGETSVIRMGGNAPVSFFTSVMQFKDIDIRTDVPFEFEESDADIDDYTPPALDCFLLVVGEVSLENVSIRVSNNQEFTLANTIFRFEPFGAYHTNVNIDTQETNASVLASRVPVMLVPRGGQAHFDSFYLSLGMFHTDTGGVPLLMVGGEDSGVIQDGRVENCIFTNFHLAGGDHADTGAWSPVQIKENLTAPQADAPKYNLFSNFLWKSSVDAALGGFDTVQPDFVIEDFTTEINKVDCGSVLGVYEGVEMLTISNICGATT